MQVQWVAQKQQTTPQDHIWQPDMRLIPAKPARLDYRYQFAWLDNNAGDSASFAEIASVPLVCLCYPSPVQLI